MRAARIWTGPVALAAGVIVGLVGAATAAPAQTTTTTTTTTTAVPPPTTVAPAGGTVHAAAVCTAGTAAAYVTAINTANTGGCNDGAGNQVISITASFTLTAAEPVYTFAAPFILNGNGFTINGGGVSRIVTTVTASTTTINNLTATNGVDADSSGGSNTRGGAVRTGGPGAGPLVVNGSTFSGNTAANGGGAISLQTGPVTITNSQFLNNTDTGDRGGALRVHGPGGGTAQAVTIIGSTFQNNHATSGDAGAIFSDGPVSLLNSTVTANSTTGGNGGGIAARGVSVAYTDVYKNSASGSGSDIFVRSGLRPAPTLQAFASVIWGSACAYQGTPTGTSYGYNYLQDTSCFPGGAAAANATDKVSTTDPGLGALANNGGPTLTLLPAPGSPLIDAVPAAACQTAPLATGVTTDQRGLPRPDAASPNCDVGAVEVQPPPAIVVQPRFTG